MSNWWQELLRFFLRGLTLQQLIHMFIILIALIIITPASIKEWVDIRNPEILPDHWMYYDAFVYQLCSEQGDGVYISGIFRQI